jgi:hypothetical protein
MLQKPHLKILLPLEAGLEVLALGLFFPLSQYCQITRTQSNFQKLNEK